MANNHMPAKLPLGYIFIKSLFPRRSTFISLLDNNASSSIELLNLRWNIFVVNQRTNNKQRLAVLVFIYDHDEVMVAYKNERNQQQRHSNSKKHSVVATSDALNPWRCRGDRLRPKQYHFVRKYNQRCSSILMKTKADYVTDTLVLHYYYYRPFLETHKYSAVMCQPEMPEIWRQPTLPPAYCLLFVCS